MILGIVRPVHNLLDVSQELDCLLFQLNRVALKPIAFSTANPDRVKEVFYAY